MHVRRHGDQVVIVHAGLQGPAEVARHLVTSPGSPRLEAAHYPPAPPGALNREPKPRTAAEAEFLAIGPGAGLCLGEAAAAGASRVRPKMARAVQLAALHGTVRSTGRSGRPAAAGSPTATCPRSWPTRRPRHPASRPGPGSPAPSPRAPAAGLPATAGRRRPVTAAQPGQPVVLSAQDAAFVRQALAAAAMVFAQAKARRPGYQAIQEAALAVPDGAPLAKVHYDACLAVDYIDFPMPVRSGRCRRRPGPPPLDEGLEQLLRRMRLPHMRRIAPESSPRPRPSAGTRPRSCGPCSRRKSPAPTAPRGHPPGEGRVPDREDVRRLGRAPASVPAPTQSALRTLEWVGLHENLVVCGPSGTGKRLLEALGQAAVAAGKNVAWFTLEQLGALLRRHRADDSDQGHLPHPAGRPRVVDD